MLAIIKGRDIPRERNWAQKRLRGKGAKTQHAHNEGKISKENINL